MFFDVNSLTAFCCRVLMVNQKNTPRITSYPDRVGLPADCRRIAAGLPAATIHCKFTVYLHLAFTTLRRNARFCCRRRRFGDPSGSFGLSMSKTYYVFTIEVTKPYKKQWFCTKKYKKLFKIFLGLHMDQETPKTPPITSQGPPRDAPKPKTIPK